MLVYRFMQQTEDGFLLDGCHPITRKGDVVDKITVKMNEQVTEYNCWFIKNEESLALFSTYGGTLGVFETDEEHTEIERTSHPDVVWSDNFKLIGGISQDDLDDKISRIVGVAFSRTNFSNLGDTVDQASINDCGTVSAVIKSEGFGDQLKFLAEDSKHYAYLKSNMLKLMTSNDKKRTAEAMYLVSYIEKHSGMSEILKNNVRMMFAESVDDDCPPVRKAYYEGLLFFGIEELSKAVMSCMHSLRWNYIFKQLGLRHDESACFFFEKKVIPIGNGGFHDLGLFLSTISRDRVGELEMQRLKYVTAFCVGKLYLSANDLDNQMFFQTYAKDASKPDQVKSLVNIHESIKESMERREVTEKGMEQILSRLEELGRI